VPFHGTNHNRPISDVMAFGLIWISIFKFVGFIEPEKSEVQIVNGIKK